MTYEGQRNPHWHGGRTVAVHGYARVLVGVGHHLADSKGYAYEHRVVAERVLGRRLLPGEEVHHKNGDRKDNRPENLEVCPARAHHAVRHRKKKNLRDPGEPNPEILCGCGCGSSFPTYDGSGRPRAYVPGHNPHEAPAVAKILSLVTSPMHYRDILSRVGSTPGALGCALSKMVKSGELVRLKPRVYGPKGSEPWDGQQISCACGCGTTLARFDANWRERRFVTGHNGRRVAP